MSRPVGPPPLEVRQRRTQTRITDPRQRDARPAHRQGVDDPPHLGTRSTELDHIDRDHIWPLHPDPPSADIRTVQPAPTRRNRAGPRGTRLPGTPRPGSRPRRAWGDAGAGRGRRRRGHANQGGVTRLGGRTDRHECQPPDTWLPVTYAENEAAGPLSEPWSGTTLIVRDEAPGAWTLQLDPTGAAHLNLWGINLIPQRLDDDHLSTLRPLLRTSLPPAPGSVPVRASSIEDEIGTLRTIHPVEPT